MSLIPRLTTHLIRNVSKQTIYPKTSLVANPSTNWWTMSRFEFSSVNDLKVEHNKQKHQFFISLGKAKAVLNYKEVKGGVIDLYHTGVPQELRGKGIAQLLAKEAFEFVVANDKQMIVSCTYLQKYLKENQFQKYVKSLYVDTTGVDNS